MKKLFYIILFSLCICSCSKDDDMFSEPAHSKQSCVEDSINGVYQFYDILPYWTKIDFNSSERECEIMYNFFDEYTKQEYKYGFSFPYSIREENGYFTITIYTAAKEDEDDVIIIVREIPKGLYVEDVKIGRYNDSDEMLFELMGVIYELKHNKLFKIK